MKKRSVLLAIIVTFITVLLLASTGFADEDLPPAPGNSPKSVAYPWVIRPDLFEAPDTADDPLIEPRIVGGHSYTPQYKYPWIVSLQFSGQHYCGGTLIDPEWILTSAHCWTDPYSGNEWGITPDDKAVLGEYQFSVVSGNEQTLSIAEVHRHPYYNYLTFEYDIALIKLSTPATINLYVDTIDFVGPNPGNLNYRDSVITGWGDHYYQEPVEFNDIVHEAEIKILPDSWCGNYGVAYDPTSMMCGGVTDYSKDACQGDSGGSLFYDSGGQFYAAGVTSWGNGCAKSGFPGVYARVSNSSHWINSVMDPIFHGSVEILSDQPVVAISRPHILTEIMAYNGSNSGAPTVYLPMLFNGKWGYTSTFTVENTGASTATFSIIFKDAQTGSTTCTMSNQSLPQHGVVTYDLINLSECLGGVVGYMPTDWFGGATISSDQALVAVAKPDINGTDAVTYSGFTGGAATAYLPMLFRGMWGYQSAFYVQNLAPGLNANLTIEFYDNQGNHTCTYVDPISIGPSVTRGYWMAAINKDTLECVGGTGFAPAGWAGSAVISTGTGSSDIVAIGRPHLGAEVAAYNGFTTGGTTNYLPMLFRGIWGYNSAFYIQNISLDLTDIVVTFYDISGNEVCIFTDPTQLEPNATRGYWTPGINCNDGRNFDPAGWAGSAKIETTQSVIAVGRPHLSNGQVVTYSAFTGGATEVYVPLNFRQWYGNETALYIQNLGGSDANTTISFYDEDNGFHCSMNKVISPGSAGAIWLASLTDAICVP